MRAFIFSMDAFVAFTLALIAIYSLIFFSSVPSGYYATLSQAHSLATDTLEALTLASCDSEFADLPQCNEDKVNLLEYLIYRSTDKSGDISFLLDDQIPEAFNYRLEVQEDEGWQTIYDSAGKPNRPPSQARKLSLSAYALAFQYDQFVPAVKNPYSYRTCKGGVTVCSAPISGYQVDSASIKLVRLVVYT